MRRCCHPPGFWLVYCMMTRCPEFQCYIMNVLVQEHQTLMMNKLKNFGCTYRNVLCILYAIFHSDQAHLITRLQRLSKRNFLTALHHHYKFYLLMESYQSILCDC